MEILERYEDGSIIALMDIKELHDHERIKKEYLKELTKEIKRDKELKRPVVVDKHSHVVLDGHHRFFALKKLHCKQIPALLVDYYNPDIKVESWHPVVKSKKEVKAIFKCLKKSAFFIEEVASKAAVNVLVESEHALAGMIVEEKKEKYYVVLDADKTFKDVMNCIQNGLKKEGIKDELDYVGDEKEVTSLLRSKKANMVITVPKMSKEQVVESGTTGEPLPPKTTRHIVPKANDYPVLLNRLKKPPKKEKEA